MVYENAEMCQSPAEATGQVNNSPRPSDQPSMPHKSEGEYENQADLGYECPGTRPDTVPSDYQDIHVYEKTM